MSGKKYIVLDTETTGLDFNDGHRIIEIGAVVVQNRKKTNDFFHTYINPQRVIDKDAQAVHGISNEELLNKPVFAEIADELIEFLEGSTVVAHNAAFDVGFINYELNLASSQYPKLEDICTIEDSLLIARKKFPGQRNSLDALTRRFEVTGYDRTYHGALKDANILADVYMLLTGGQSRMNFEAIQTEENSNEKELTQASLKNIQMLSIIVDEDDLKAHNARLEEIEKKSGIKISWN
ncbi:MAG: DNA polymerase III subunit epsilon [Gammaproteobacteria bacterium]